MRRTYFSFTIPMVKQHFLLFLGELTALAVRELIMSLKIIRRARLMHPAARGGAECRPGEYLPGREHDRAALNRVVFAANSTRDSIVIERG